MTEAMPKLRPARVWLPAAIVAAVAGGVTVAAFSAWWFAEVGGHCGVVRFYEQAFGVILIAGWLAGTAGGLYLVFIGRRKGAGRVAMGSLIAVLANIAVLIVCVMVVRTVREADYTLKNTEELLNFLAGDDLDARKLSAHALGERRAAGALLPLCVILDDTGEEINLRHNAAIALGRICAPPYQGGVDVTRALSSLAGALGGPDEYLPHSIAEAFARIGDPRAIAPLGVFLSDKTRPVHSREVAAKALGEIGGSEAQIALENALAGAEDGSLVIAIQSAIKVAGDPKGNRRSQ